MIRPLDITIYHLPQADVLPIVRGYLNLADLMIVERVCKLWHDISLSDNANWDRVAYQKAIFVDRTLSVRPQVFASFKTYCEAAKKVFPHLTSQTREAIDIEIAEMDKSGVNPLEFLTHRLSFKQSPVQSIELGASLIQDCIHMIPVFVEAGLLTITEDIYSHLLKNEGYLSTYINDINEHTDKIEKCVESLILNEIHENFYLLTTLFENLQKAVCPLIEYILHFVEIPSQKILNYLCASYAFIPLMRKWHQIAFNYQKNCPSGDPKEFIANEGIDLETSIQYPPFIQNLLKRVKTQPYLTHSISGNLFIDFMNNQMEKDFRRSLNLLRND